MGPNTGPLDRVESLPRQTLRSLLRTTDLSLVATTSRALKAELRIFRKFLTVDGIPEAARLLDRIWRVYPDHAATTAPLLGRMLVLSGADHYASLRALTLAADLAPDPEVAALIGLAYMELQRVEDARQTLHAALSQFCVESGGLLALACSTYVHRPEAGTAGWVGRGPGLKLVGEIASGNEAHGIEISLQGHPTFIQMLSPADDSGARLFSIAAPPGVENILTVSCRGQTLLGSGTHIPPNFGLDGRTTFDNGAMTGWVRMGWMACRPPRLRVEDQNGTRHEFKTHATCEIGLRWPFEVELAGTLVRGNRLTVSARMPDGRWQELPDSPLLLESALQVVDGASSRLRTWKALNPKAALAETSTVRAAIVDVIIPVFGHAYEALACIHSVLATVDEQVHVLVIDDASHDNLLAKALDDLADQNRIDLVRNSENLGFVASVNLGMSKNPNRDVVLLNSDTRVFSDWLSRLRAAAYSAQSIGTVTPFTNSGSIASYPDQAGSASDPLVAANVHDIASATLDGERVELPVGVGFCLYIRRDCLKDTGEFDARTFGKGYGEETDFCLRARARGWTHVLAADVFVYHTDGTSFGSRRQSLLERSQRLLNLRHRGFDAYVRDFLKGDTLHNVRRSLDEKRLLTFPGKFVLIVTLSHPGGVNRFVAERVQRLTAQGFHALLLKPAGVGDMKRSVLSTDALSLPNLRYDIPADLSQLNAILRRLPLQGIELQHFLDLDPRLIELVRSLGVAYHAYVHDYTWICPRITLIDGRGSYCEEPAVSVCQTCVKRNGSNLSEEISVSALRTRSAIWLRGAARVIAPSADSADRIKRYINGLQVDVEPHSSVTLRSAPGVRVRVRKNTRIVVMGAIGKHKGFQVLLECARDVKLRKLPLEFVVIGHTENDPLLRAAGPVFITGYYDDSEAAHLLQREQADIAWLPSVWPETWCYTLDYILAAGLPVVAFNIGAIAERLRTVGHAKLLPLQMDAALINDWIIQHARSNVPDASGAMKSGKSLVSKEPDDASMAAVTTDETTMNDPLAMTSSQDAREDGLSASVQVLPLPAGLFLFSVQTTTSPSTNGVGQLALPALHVGLGPGIRPDQVEFLSGPSTHGAWLFSNKDLLVAKVGSSGATLVMTSVRAPAGDVLSIKVEKLDERANGAVTSAAIAPVNTDNAAAAGDTGVAVFDGAGDLPLPVQIGAHIRTRGDVKFTNSPWAGRLGTGLWLESFSVRPLDRFSAHDIEYKGLTGTGFETPWISDEKMCGTRGMATPLIGFAIRLKPSSTAAAFDCEYSGYFQSGTTVGPIKNGAPCRSSVANDTLEGIQVRLIRRAATVLAESGTKPGASVNPAPEVDSALALRQPARRT